MIPAKLMGVFGTLFLAAGCEEKSGKISPKRSEAPDLPRARFADAGPVVGNDAGVAPSFDGGDYFEGSSQDPVCVDRDLDGICKGFSPDEDCNDTNRDIPGIEVCDGIDNDCNREVDEGLENCSPAEDVFRTATCEDPPRVIANNPLYWHCEEGEARECGTCDYGSQVCEEGDWSECDFQPPPDGLEQCPCHQGEIGELSAAFLFILDTSGSMATAYPNGQTRYIAASLAIETILNTYGNRADFGILAFPADWFEDPSGCPTRTPQVPIGGEVDAIRNILDRSIPGGMTPLGASIELGGVAMEEYTANHLDTTPAVIILSDGGESCGGDPVAALNGILALGIRVYLLDASGGELEDVGHALNNPQNVYDVINPDEFLEALNDIMTRFSLTVPYLEEECNGVDDDCDGLIDEGFQRFVYSGEPQTAGIGICASGIEVCVMGQMLTVEPEILPAREICDGMDNDCNGETDECFQVMEPCKWFGDPLELRNNPCGHKIARTACDPDLETLVCEPPVPTEEICNRIDDDCNGVIDDVAGFEPCEHPSP